ncbi:MAG: ABC transporter permease, partial [Candidatus Aminicenantes bacterium]|nr:ABC transporter permease [Candidatus Aminicenantes bacterium]
LGIIIGVAAVVAVVSVVQGLSFMITSQLQEAGADFIIVVPNRPRGEAGEMLGRIELTYEDGLAVKEKAPEIKDFSPLLQRRATVKFADENTYTNILCTSASFQEINNHYVDRGRFLTKLDNDHRKKVCVLGTKVVEDLGIKGNPLGRGVSIRKLSFTIIGVLEERGQALGQNADDVCIIPFNTSRLLFGEEASRSLVLYFRAESAENIDLAKEQITETLRKQHSLKSGQPDDFLVLLQQDLLERINTILGSVTAVVAGIVGISLVVGGIGIMNIMLVSVTERTREIGIRKAVGAKRRDIIFQFLVEAIILSLVGGAIGIIFGYSLGVIVTKFIPQLPPAHVPLWAVGLGFGFSTLVGLFFGIYPAARAGKLDPIEALRYE